MNASQTYPFLADELKQMDPENVSKSILRFTALKAPAGWRLALLLSLAALSVGLACGIFTVYKGIGTWGLNNSVGWGMDITNFVWWIGIGHAGTFISAILLILQQGWRTGINRAAEAMTIFSLLCAALFPVIHLGRTDHVFYSLPYPNTRNIWVNFNSPLVWDVFAILTYFTVSFIYWYVGMLPDLALYRDNSKSRLKSGLYSLLSMGWTGASRQWERYQATAQILAVVATPLVISVHSIVSMDFSTSLIPGWHSTLFPALFVTGAIFSGFAMVQILAIITRKAMNLELFITHYHIRQMNKIILLTCNLLLMAYATEMFLGWYSANPYELTILRNRVSGIHAPIFYPMILLNVVFPQLLWIRRFRNSIAFTFVLSILILAGMWLERFLIIIGSLQRDYIPARWTHYAPTPTEIGIFAGTLGLFLTLYLLFVRYLPLISFSEIKHQLLVFQSNKNRHGE